MKTGTIIFLNGTSSSGKTSILRTLQNVLEEPYLEAGIDKFIWMLPERYLERPVWDDVLGLASQAGAMGHLLVSGMHQTVETLACAGLNVIADHVLVEPAWLEDCARRFHPYQAFLVGVQCPLSVLESREKDRRNRTLGQARAQHSLVHRHGVYDLEVDTSQRTPEECALLIKCRIEDGAGPRALREIFPTAGGHSRSGRK